MPRRFNCCEFNHPCPIFCPFIDFTCSNDVVNPNFNNDFAFFNNTAVGDIGAGAIIPLTLVTSQGDSFLSGSVSGSVFLAGGIYEINYFAGGTAPAGGSIAISLAVNGTAVAGSQVSVTTTAGSTSNLTRTIVVTINEPSVLTLVSSTGETVDFNFASMFIRRL